MNVYITQIEIRLLDGTHEYHGSNISYTLEEAITAGKELYNSYYKCYCEDDIDFDTFMKDKDCYFFVNIVSGNRKRFNSYDELMKYFNDNINNIPNDKLYDFLLSLVNYEYRAYDYKGNYIACEAMFEPIKDQFVAWDIKFSMESCKNRDFIFRLNY